MKDSFKQNFNQIVSRAATIRVRSVMNSSLWLVAVALPTCLVGGWFAGFDTPVGIGLSSLGGLTVVVAIIKDAVFAFTDPDRLQSEEYLLRREEILILSKSGERLDPEALGQIFNPAAEKSDDREPGR